MFKIALFLKGKGKFFSSFHVSGLEKKASSDHLRQIDFPSGQVRFPLA